MQMCVAGRNTRTPLAAAIAFVLPRNPFRVPRLVASGRLD
jgi:hypothetical protein